MIKLINLLSILLILILFNLIMAVKIYQHHDDEYGIFVDFEGFEGFEGIGFEGIDFLYIPSKNKFMIETLDALLFFTCPKDLLENQNIQGEEVNEIANQIKSYFDI